MKIFKNMYDFSFGRYCGIFIDEKTMKKIAKLQYETYQKLRSIIENSENVMSANWSIAKEPATLKQDERIFRYSEVGESSHLRLELMKDLFQIIKVDNLYIGSRKDAEAEHTEHLKQLNGEADENRNHK